jgi:multidrug efflux pump subunit AcrA (membrane-fusion protein)
VTQPEGVRRQIEEAQQAYEAAYMPPPQGEPEAKPDPVPDAAGQLHDWKLRFTNYKASADREIAGLRQSVAGLQQQLSSAVEALNSAKAERERAQARVVPSDLLSDEEKDLLGEENLAVVAKVADAKAHARTSELEAQVRKLQEQLSFYSGREAQREQVSEDQLLRQKLTQAYPHWEKHDNDPRFRAWMAEPDPLTGRPRLDYFRVARTAGDISRIADFYREFGTKVGGDPRAEMVQPASRPGAAQAEGKRLWTKAMMEQLYTDKKLGRLSQEDASALEADLFAAQREGRLRM